MKRSSNILSSNAGIKLISLALAVMLEFYFYSQDNSTTQLISAVLEFQNIPSNRLIIDPTNAEEGIPAHIEVNGPKSLVRQISQGFHVLKIPFPEKAAFTFPIDINYDSLQLPPSVKIISARPARLTVRSVELLRKELPIEIPVEGQLPAGFELKELKIFPKTVIARGPLQEIQKLDAIKLEPLNLTGMGESAKFELKIKNPADQTSLNVNLVSVEVDIGEKLTTKEYKEILIDDGQGVFSLGKKVRFDPPRVKVVLKGKASSLENLNFKVSVVEKLDKLPKRTLLKVQDLPEGVFVEKIIPDFTVAKSVN